jgi:hypothetical protein
METAEGGMRYGGGTFPNLNYTVPRRSHVAYLGANGFTKTRLPIKWEMLQPMLHDTVASTSARAIIGEPGVFHAGYESYITGVLDAHAAAGIKCVIDLHNYCRYRDFIFQPDGSVLGLVKPGNALIYAYTGDSSQVRERIFSLAAGATLKQSNFTDFWARAARKWKDHPGFGGYGLMNEPHNLPGPGGTEASYDGSQDLHIWATYAQAAINAIRAVDPANPIYLGGNDSSGAMWIGSRDPDWPLTGANIIYEVHMYLDSRTSGQRYDYDSETAAGFSVGQSGTINVDTGVERLRPAVEWAQARGLKLALTETGMPIDDVRWQEMYQKLLDYARQNSVEVFSWNGGNHWSVRNAGINVIPGWHQNKTLEPSACGPMKSAAGVAKAVLYDDGPGWAPSGTAVAITVYARGYLAAPVSLEVSSSNGGSFSKTTLTLPAGANTQDTFTFTSPPNAVVTLRYTSSSASLPPPPPRKVFSLSDPVAYASTSVADAALAIMAKYSACKWEMGDGYTDYLQGAPSGEGQPIRAVSDSGYGSSAGNAMEMLNWVNIDSAAMGTVAPPVMRTANGKKSADHSYWDTWGLWCKKTLPFPEIQANPRNRTPYAISDSHFTIAAVSVPGAGSSGLVFQASQSGHVNASELRFTNGQPQVSIVDTVGTSVLLTSPTALAANTPAVISLTSVAGAQRLRVNSSVAGSGSATFSASPCDQLLIGWGFSAYYPKEPFTGNIFSVITGKGAPTVQEMAVLERYLGTTAGIVI